MPEAGGWCRPAQAAPGCDVIGYAIEAEKLQELRRIISRLYSAEPISFDQRRDIAFRLSLCGTRRWQRL